MRSTLLIALPKGRLFDAAIGLLQRAGVDTDGGVGSRKLTFMDKGGQYEFVALKPADVPVYVESGAVDAGIVGSDVLRELECDVNEPLDLRIGLCRLAVAAIEGSDLTALDHLRIATKYPRTATRFFSARHQHTHIVRLEGSVEIAPILGLADAIVDLVETGRTLKENGLGIVEEIAPVSAKFVVNRTAMKTRNAAVRKLITSLDKVIYAHP
ncbi:MAG: ATP phosphoribosyltransferase [Ignavibacteriae bacterium]|nr:ATP phosphoribosyltransferase [Ignavibacteriota bacterium]